MPPIDNAPHASQRYRCRGFGAVTALRAAAIPTKTPMNAVTAARAAIQVPMEKCCKSSDMFEILSTRPCGAWSVRIR
jgi:hypothetical protein